MLILRVLERVRRQVLTRGQFHQLDFVRPNLAQNVQRCGHVRFERLLAQSLQQRLWCCRRVGAQSPRARRHHRVIGHFPKDWP